MQGPSGGKEEEEDAEAMEGDLETVAELGFDEQIINLVLEAGASMACTFPRFVNIHCAYRHNSITMRQRLKALILPFGMWACIGCVCKKTLCVLIEFHHNEATLGVSNSSFWHVGFYRVCLL